MGTGFRFKVSTEGVPSLIFCIGQQRYHVSSCRKFGRPLTFSESASKLDPRLQSGLFMFAVSNSCMNPILYGKANSLQYEADDDYFYAFGHN